MERRSTNTKFVHFQGDLVSNVDSSHGVRLTGGSTGAIVESIGDDTNVSLRLRSQGAGGVILGSTAQSTTPIAAIQRYLVQYTVPVLSSGASDISTVTVTGLTTNGVLMLAPRVQSNSSVVGVVIEPRCSTADELVLTYSNVSVSSLGGSTQQGTLLQFRF